MEQESGEYVLQEEIDGTEYQYRLPVSPLPLDVTVGQFLRLNNQQYRQQWQQQQTQQNQHQNQQQWSHLQPQQKHQRPSVYEHLYPMPHQQQQWPQNQHQNYRQTHTSVNHHISQSSAQSYVETGMRIRGGGDEEGDTSGMRTASMESNRRGSSSDDDESTGAVYLDMISPSQWHNKCVCGDVKDPKTGADFTVVGFVDGEYDTDTSGEIPAHVSIQIHFISLPTHGYLETPQSTTFDSSVLYVLDESSSNGEVQQVLTTLRRRGLGCFAIPDQLSALETKLKERTLETLKQTRRFHILGRSVDKRRIFWLVSDPTHLYAESVSQDPFTREAVAPQGNDYDTLIGTKGRLVRLRGSDIVTLVVAITSDVIKNNTALAIDLCGEKTLPISEPFWSSIDKNRDPLVVLWKNIATLFKCDSTGEFRLSDNELVRPTRHFVSNDAKDDTCVVFQPNHFMECDGERRDCSLCSLPYEGYLAYELSDEKSTPGCAPISEFLVGHECSIEWPESRQAQTAQQSDIERAQSLLLRIESIVPDELKVAANDRKLRCSWPGIFHSRDSLAMWKYVVTDSVNPRLLSQAFVTLRASIDHSKLPSWWSRHNGWSQPFLLMSQCDLSSLFVHIYILDAALSEYIALALKANHGSMQTKPQGFAVQKNDAPTVESTERDYGKYRQMGLSSGFSRYTGSHESFCLVCDREGGKLLSCQFCMNVQHKDCSARDSARLADSNNFICNVCVHDIENIDGETSDE